MPIPTRAAHPGVFLASLLALCVLSAQAAQARDPGKDESGTNQGQSGKTEKGETRDGRERGAPAPPPSGRCCERVSELEAEVARLREQLRRCDGDHGPGHHPGDDPVPSHGCVRSHGYWKTHQPWPTDGTLCGRPWREVLAAEPGGDAWSILAHQWIAARLDEASGAAVPAEVARALRDGGRLLNGCSISAADRQRALEVKDVLDAYVNGRLGVEKCH